VNDGIGPTLREARNRRRIDLAEVEAATKIRLRYLRAMENEEWDVLPGGPYTRSFIRTYASHLGLDGERLADEYARGASGEGERAPRAEPAAPARAGATGPRFRGRAWAVLVSLGLIGVVIVVGVVSGRGSRTTREPARVHEPGKHRSSVAAAPRPRPGVAVRLTATAEVWVCLLDAAGVPLIDGRILEAGAEEGPFRSKRFTVSFGNGGVEMRVDGRRAEIPATASPVGYEVGPGGELKPLTESARPTCT
jgi:cytoskeleton protein RodZ